jgi:hypothetical protein
MRMSSICISFSADIITFPQEKSSCKLIYVRHLECPGFRKSLQCADWKGEGPSGFKLD